MRYLVANNHIRTVGGSESFTWAMADELERRGHEVRVADANGLIYGGDLGSTDPTKYDGAFISHNTTARWLFRTHPDFDPRRVIQTVHGTASPLETPYTSRPIKHVVVSEELRRVYPEYHVIMNGVDLEKFKPAKEKSGLLSLCQSDEMNRMIAGVCEGMGIPFSWRDKNVNPKWDISDEINSAEITVGLGRSAIEGMAAGCSVIVADARAYQGPWIDGVVTFGSYVNLAAHNFSGRSGRVPVTSRLLQASIEFCLDKKDCGRETRTLAEQHHDIRTQVDTYMAILEA